MICNKFGITLYNCLLFFSNYMLIMFDIEGRRHDARIFLESGLQYNLQRYSFDVVGNPLCIYGDPAYPVTPFVQGPFKGARLTEIQSEFNTLMSSVRIAVEYPFGGIANYFAFIDFKKKQKLYLQAVGKIYIVSSILYNAMTCLYGNQASDLLGVEPPILEEYFGFRQ